MRPLNEAETIRATGLVLTRLTEPQLARVRQAAAERGWYVTEYLRNRIVSRMGVSA